MSRGNDMRRLLFRRGFSDKLYWYNFRTVWMFVAACFVLNALSGYLGVTDMAVVAYGVPAAFGELGIHTGFIIWKAKTENCRKNKDYSNLRELEDEDL